MSIPSSQSLPPEESELLSPARRRRRQRLIISGSDQQAVFLQELAHRVTPSGDLFLMAILAVLVLGAAILLDVPALFVLAALLSPFLGPVLGMGLASISGAPRFFFQSLGGLLLAGLIYFVGGLGAGWVASSILWKDMPVVPSQVFYHAVFSWPDLVVLSAGAVLSAFLLVQDNKQKPLVSSVALAYEIFLPVGAAGFGLSSGLPGLFPNALVIALTHLILAVLWVTGILAVQGLRPRDRWGFTFATVLGMGILVSVVGLSNLGPLPIKTHDTPIVVTLARPLMTETSLVYLPKSSATPTPKRANASSTPQAASPEDTTPTHTLVPTFTPSVTSSPAPTPVYAKISAHEDTGAIVREQPDYTSKVVKTLLNDSLVEILPGVSEKNGQVWINVRLPDGSEGWIVRYLVITTTPVR